MKDNVAICVFAVAAFAVAVLSVEVASYPMQDSNGGQLVANTDSSHKGVVLSDNRSRAYMQLYLLSLLEKLGSLPNNERLRTKKTCLLNAGLSHSCDYRDALAAVDEKYYLGSDLTPGRK